MTNNTSTQAVETADSATGAYAPINGLNMYYEVHGPATGIPVVLLHGAFSAIGSSFGQVIPELAKNRRVIGVDMQGHGRTADIDRPLTIEQLADDIAALLEYLKIDKADIFGYSAGAGVALHLVLRHPEVVRKLVLASVTYNMDGFYPGLMEGMKGLQPEHLMGSPWHAEYMAIAPRPEDFPTLVGKVKNLEQNIRDVSDAEIAAIKSPTLIILADSDIIQPEHAVAMFRLLGGGVVGENAGLPNSQLAILPGTMHSSLVTRGSWLSSMVSEFLDAPVREAASN